MATIQSIKTDCADAATKISEIAGELINMIVIDDNAGTTDAMGTALKGVGTEVSSVVEAFSSNQTQISDILSEFGLNNPSSFGGGGRAYTGGARPYSNVFVTHM